MACEKKAVSRVGIGSAAERSLEQLSEAAKARLQGVMGDKTIEAVPEFIKTPSEKVYKNGNAWIVMGRDRPAGRASGYGGAGDTQAASIDIVVGRMGGQPIAKTKHDETVFVDPQLKTDSARIYISQKTDIDENFGLSKGTIGNTKTRSAIAIKADAVRLIGREGIKLVTSCCEKNSQGAESIETKGIDLIAGNDDSDLQPLVKGDNLIKAINRLLDLQEELNACVSSFLSTQIDFNIAMGQHIHPTFFGGTPAVVSPPGMTAAMRASKDLLLKSELSLKAHTTNLTTFKTKYLENDYILSEHNNTT